MYNNNNNFTDNRYKMILLIIDTKVIRVITDIEILVTMIIIIATINFILRISKNSTQFFYKSKLKPRILEL